MAKFELNNPQNKAGAVFVDRTCIDCGTCYHIAPQIFFESNNLSYVHQQPVTLAEWSKVREAVVSCPTNSIGVQNAPVEFRKAELILPRKITNDIYFCGYTSKDSYGATSYFIRHPKGNILVDSPRFNSHLVKEFEAMGGISIMFLTHQDDVADHKKFAEHFKCKRIIHFNDIGAETVDCEIVLQGEKPIQIAEDFLAIPTPGHTRGHMVLLYQNHYLFSGDHLFYDQEQHTVYASEGVSWYSWPLQVKSIHKLAAFDIDWIFPGHGGWGQSSSEKIKKEILEIGASP